MQFVKDGPELPNSLLDLHEEGRVVFFCGAGISYPAGLKNFKGLVDDIYAELRTTRDSIEDDAYRKNQFDATLNLLERRHFGGPSAVRRAVPRVLKPKLRASGATLTHKALLTLSRDRESHTHLITTNFDRVFEAAMKGRDGAKFRIPTFQAPLLPVPKAGRWDGLIYLHGLLSEAPTDKELSHLVLSSADFGLAYLVERWASRFVSELFRNYIVCFVGYSIDDPVLRYMMDALAADRRLGQAIPRSYAFGGYVAGQRDQADRDWRAKGVDPILFEIQMGSFAALHDTLREWAGAYRDGVNAKEQIVVRYALAKPAGSTAQDDYVGRTLWALSDRSGLPAKRFADFDPLPSIDWLVAMWEQRFQHSDLYRFGVTPNAEVDEKLKFGLLYRPSPYNLSAWMSPFDVAVDGGRWDEAMSHLARWLARHISDPFFILWTVGRGAPLHPAFVRVLHAAVSSPGVSGPVKKAWEVILGGKIRTASYSTDAFQWFQELQQAGELTPVLKGRLRDLLRPKVRFSKPFRLYANKAETEAAPLSIRKLMDWEVTLSSDNVHVIFGQANNKQAWLGIAGQFLSEGTDLLREALDLMGFLEGAEAKSDLSYLHQPSIEEHSQNQHFQEWTTLIDVVRDAWLAVARDRIRLARVEVERWGEYRYPIFRRLALFAAAQDHVYAPGEALEILVAEGAWWLWSSETQYEALRLLSKLVGGLSEAEREQLQHVILRGPPKDMYRATLTDEQWALASSEAVWLRLAAWRDAVVPLPNAAQARMQELLVGREDRAQAPGEDRLFPFWMGSGQDWRKFSAAPVEGEQLLLWLREHPTTPVNERDNWQELCKSRMRPALWSLLKLAKEGSWPVERWKDALQVWMEEQYRARSWKWLASTLSKADDQFISNAAASLIWWLRPMADGSITQPDIWIALVVRIIQSGRNDPAPDVEDPVQQAINTPVGQGTEALLHWWYRQDLQDKQGLPYWLRGPLTDLCNLNVGSFRNGRLLLAQAVITLFRVDVDWTSQHLLPLFSWTADQAETGSAWQGFLWTARLYLPFLTAIKDAFLATANHYAELGESGESYATLLVFVSLDAEGRFSTQELATALALLPQQGLRQSAAALVSALEGAGAQKREYWENRIVPYLDNVWPKVADIITSEISALFARLCVAAGEAFEDAYQVLRDWLRHLPQPDHPIHLLSESELATRFPVTALEFLNSIMGNAADWAPTELPNCLNQIQAAQADLAQDPRFVRLFNYARQQGLM